MLEKDRRRSKEEKGERKRKEERKWKEGRKEGKKERRKKAEKRGGRKVAKKAGRMGGRTEDRRHEEGEEGRKETGDTGLCWTEQKSSGASSAFPCPTSLTCSHLPLLRSGFIPGPGSLRFLPHLSAELWQHRSSQEFCSPGCVSACVCLTFLPPDLTGVGRLG